MYNGLKSQMLLLDLRYKMTEARDGELLLLREAVNDECMHRKSIAGLLKDIKKWEAFDA